MSEEQAYEGAQELTILVIDDDEAMRELFVQMLSLDGHQVIPVASAEEGLEQLPYFTFQVAFLDQNLPGMEGLVLGEYLRKNNPHMQIALVTGESDPRLERVSRRHDIVFIPKPFDVADIREVVATCLRKAAARQAERAKHQDPDYELDLAPHHEALAKVYNLAGVSQRIEDKLVWTIRTSLSNLRSVSRYNERDRAIALSGLVTAQVLGVNLPKDPGGQTLFEVYDEAMIEHHRRPAFSSPPGSESQADEG